MKTPKVEFEYSWIYDQNLREWLKAPKDKNTPTPNEVWKFIKWAEPRWRKREKAVLTEMSKVAKLPWKEDKIICYVVGWAIPFSQPLTIPMYTKPDKEYFFDVLTHELIHNLFVQPGNFERSKAAWKYSNTKYKDENQNVQVHIPLHAMHEHLFRKFSGEKRLQQEYNSMKHLSAYKRSWDIVRRDGYENIIQEFTKRIKK